MDAELAELLKNGLPLWKDQGFPEAAEARGLLADIGKKKRPRAHRTSPRIRREALRQSRQTGLARYP
ncbi:MAG: hypothetical protein M5R36_27460 [Deltaproteobacteria bacterium]|nr:hypothetical protein [Deltaproteobacteria bacterium]